ncbi:MAG: MFS transporter [Candidatus Thorarchaeota archaeon]
MGEGNSIEETIHPDKEDDVSELSWLQAVRRITSNRNWTVFVSTVWIYSSMFVFHSYWTLYFRDIGITYIFIGVLFSLMYFMTLIGSFFSGYIVDNYDRRNLTVITMIFPVIPYLTLAFSNDGFVIALALLIGGMSEFTSGSGNAYQMEQLDRRLGGVAQSLFTLGTALGVVPLYVFALMLDLGITFVIAMRIFFFIAAILQICVVLIRAFGLEQLPLPERPERSDSLLKDFVSENIRGFKLLVRVLPVLLLVLTIDALSDSFYGFASTYFVNETLEFGYIEINLMILITLMISVPLALVLGRVFDKHGGQRLTLAVYSIMPISILLLIISQYVRYIAPINWISAIDSIYPGLSVIFSLAFIATAMKSINDILWIAVINTYILKSIPATDFGKMYTYFRVLPTMFLVIGPILAGFIYTNWQGLPLLVMTMILNVMLLVLLVVKNLEPRVGLEELETELNAVHE